MFTAEKWKWWTKQWHDEEADEEPLVPTSCEAVSSSEVVWRHLCSYKTDGITLSRLEHLDRELLFIHHTRSTKCATLPDYFKKQYSRFTCTQFLFYLHFILQCFIVLNEVMFCNTYMLLSFQKNRLTEYLVHRNPDFSFFFKFSSFCVPLNKYKNMNIKWTEEKHHLL
jgi:hypothetical protein